MRGNVGGEWINTVKLLGWGSAGRWVANGHSGEVAAGRAEGAAGLRHPDIELVYIRWESLSTAQLDRWRDSVPTFFASKTGAKRYML